jgi:hypothetical protein
VPQTEVVIVHPITLPVGKPRQSRLTFDAREGSKGEILAASKCFPLCSQKKWFLSAAPAEHLPSSLLLTSGGAVAFPV